MTELATARKPEQGGGALGKNDNKLSGRVHGFGYGECQDSCVFGCQGLRCPPWPRPFRGVRPLHVAAGKGHLSVVDRLLEAKAEVEAENKHGRATHRGGVWEELQLTPKRGKLSGRLADSGSRMKPKTRMARKTNQGGEIGRSSSFDSLGHEAKKVGVGFD